MDAAATQITTYLQAIFFKQQNIKNNKIIGSQFREILPFSPIIGCIDAISFIGLIVAFVLILAITVTSAKT